MTNRFCVFLSITFIYKPILIKIPINDNMNLSMMSKVGKRDIIYFVIERFSDFYLSLLQP